MSNPKSGDPITSDISRPRYIPLQEDQDPQQYFQAVQNYPAPAVQNYPVPQIVAYDPPPQLVVPPSRTVAVEDADWVVRWPQSLWQRLEPPTGDVFSVVGEATPTYCFLVKADICGLKMLPFLLTGSFWLKWTEGHMLGLLASATELQDICNRASEALRPLSKKVNFT